MARHVSRPMRSARASGPSGWPSPSFITVSTASGVATPSITQKIASLIIGMSTRFDTNPGASLTSTGVFPRALAISSVRRVVPSAVSSPRTTSTSCITGTGFMKCIPITCAGRLVAAASAVIEIEEVLEERIAAGGAARSSSRKNASLILASSLAASTTKSASRTASTDVLVPIRPSVSAPCSLPPTPFLTRRSMFASIVLAAPARPERPPPRARGVARVPAHGERREGVGEEVAACRPEQPPQTRDPERREHREARRAEREIEEQARRPERGTEQPAHHEHGERLQGQGHRRAGERHRQLSPGRDERRAEQHGERAAGGAGGAGAAEGRRGGGAS